MAQRYGGKYSPDPQSRDSVSPFENRKVDPAGARSNVMFVPAGLLAFFSVKGGATALAFGLPAAAILGLGAWLLRDGLRAEAAYNARAIAKRPALPRKILAGILTGVGIAGAALSHGSPSVAAAIFGIAGTALHLAAFGIDPLKDKRTEGVDDFQASRVSRVVDEAEIYLADMRNSIETLGDRRLDGRVAAFQLEAQRMIDTVQSDPRDLTGARKYLGVYLMGARDASLKFAEHYGKTHDENSRAEYEALLSDLQTNFSAMTGKLRENNRLDMDIEIKVLRDRLQREGVRPD